MPVTNPFIPADLRTVLASRPTPGASFIYQKRVTQDGPRSFTSSTNTYQAVLGIEGMLGDDWQYDAYYSRGQSSPKDRSVAGSISISALQRLLDAPDGGASLCTGGYNVFGPNPVSASCADYIAVRTTTETDIDQDEFAVNATGGLFALPAGEVKLAIGANHRRNSYQTKPDPLIQAGDIAAVVAVQPTTGDITVTEGVAEVLVPVLANVPLIDSFNLNLGYRYSDYNLSGAVSTYKVNFDWRMFGALLLRGGHQKAVRAPNVAELFLPPGGVIANIGAPPASGDPCDARSSFRTGASAANIRTLCLAQGIPASVIDTYNQANVGQPSVTQGNRNLSPETAKSYTVGAVLHPTFLGEAFERMSLSIDYYNIRIDETIASLGVQNTLNKCFNADGSNPTYSVTNFYCTLIERNALNGQISRATQPLLNLGGYRTSGVDGQLDWNAPLWANNGNLIVNLTVNYLDKFEIQQQPGTPFQDFTGTIGGASTNARWKYSGSLAYDRELFQVGVRWRHTSAFRDASVVTNPASTIPGPESVNYVDLFGRFRAGEKVELRAGVTNVGDVEPEQVGSLRGFTNPAIYDVIGRAYYAGFRFTY